MLHCMLQNVDLTDGRTCQPSHGGHMTSEGEWLRRRMWRGISRHMWATWRHEGRGTSASQSAVTRWRHRLGGAAAGRSRHQLTQLALKLASEEAVDDEVWRRVDGDDEVADVVESHVRWTRWFSDVVHNVVENLQVKTVKVSALIYSSLF